MAAPPIRSIPADDLAAPMDRRADLKRFERLAGSSHRRPPGGWANRKISLETGSLLPKFFLAGR